MKLFNVTTILFIFCTLFSAIGLAINPVADYIVNERKLFEKLKSTSTPQVFVQNISFFWKGSRPPQKIEYGNPEIGFFSSNRFQILDKKIQFRFVPPTYKSAIQFYAIGIDDKKYELGSHKYINLFEKFFANKIYLNGQFSFPFMVVNGTSRAIPMIINKLGEVIWLYDNQVDFNLATSSAIEILDNGEFIFFLTNSSTRLTRINSFGETALNISFDEKKIPYPNSHTVQFLKKTNEILFLTNDCRELSRWDEFLPLFHGPQGWLRLFTLPRRSYRGSKLVRMSLDTLKVKEIWNSFETYSPKNNPSRAMGPLVNMDRFLDARDEESYKRLINRDSYLTWVNWPDKRCSIDWTHENSAYYVENKGYLISVRNLNEIIFLDEGGHLQWSVGEGSGHTYPLPYGNDAFSMQHSATPLADNKILVYDNHNAYRGFTDERMYNRVMIIDLNKKNSASVPWQVILPNIHSEIRGSASWLENKHIFAYSAGDPGTPISIYDIDYESKEIQGILRYQLLGGVRGFEAKALWALSGDKYIGTFGQAPAPKQLIKSEEDSDILRFSY